MELERIKIPVAAISGVTISWLGHHAPLIVFVVVAVVLDYITGVLAGRENEGLNSKRARNGLFKKVGMLSLLALGFLLDTSINHYIASGLNFSLPFSLPIGLIVSAWLVITEAISICENLSRLGVPIPGWLLILLKKTQTRIDDKEDITDMYNQVNYDDTVPNNDVLIPAPEPDEDGLEEQE